MNLKDPKTIGLLAGGGVAAYLLYQWWRDQQEISENINVERNGAVAPAQPAPPTAFVPAPVAPAVTEPVATPPVPAPSTVIVPTEQQAVDPAYWESMARSLVVELGLGALPPWPGIGPTPHPYLGPTYSLTPYR